MFATPFFDHVNVATSIGKTVTAPGLSSMVSPPTVLELSEKLAKFFVFYHFPNRITDDDSKRLAHTMVGLATTTRITVLFTANSHEGSTETT